MYTSTDEVTYLGLQAFPIPTPKLQWHSFKHAFDAKKFSMAKKVSEPFRV